MTMAISGVEPLRVEGVEIQVGDAGIKLMGVLSMRSPSETVTPFLRRVHAATLKLGKRTLTVDMTELRFMNSSSIRSLVDWVEWIRGEPEAQRYTLCFVTKHDSSWQSTTLAAIRAFGGEIVSVSAGR